MKKILTLILLLIPSVVFGAIASGWQATSTTQGWIFPTRINGTDQTVLGTNFIASSTKPSVLRYASTTALTVSGVASTSILRIDTLSNGCLILSSGLVGTQVCAVSNSKWATSSGSTITPNGGGGIYVDSSSTITSLFVQQSTSTAATSTTSWADIGRAFRFISNYFTATSTTASTFPYASSTALTVSGVASTSVLRIDTLADGCLNVSSGLVGRQTCGTVTGVTGTWPIFSSGGAAPVISFGGLSTSSAAVIGNIPYFSGVNTFANVATSAPTISTGLSYSGTIGYLVGGVSGNLTNTGVITVGNGTGITCSGTNPATCSLGAIAANSILANNTSGSAIPVALATSSFFSLTQPTTISYASTTALSVSGALMVNNASSSINNLKIVNASTTNLTATFASSTAITVSGVASTSVLRIDTLADGCLNIASGLVGSQACGGGGGNSKWATSSTFITQNAATRVGISSSTPWATFGINPIAGNASNAFAIGSSTATRFLVNNAGDVAVGTTSPRGIFDVNSISTYSIGNVGSGSLAFTYGSGTCIASNIAFQYNVYAYSSTAVGRVYAATPKLLSGTDNNSGNPFVVDLSWGSVSGADGYLLVVTQDGCFGAAGNYSLDTTFTTASIDDGIDSVSGSSYQSGAGVTPSSPYRLGPDFYINRTSGDGKLVGSFSIFGTASTSALRIDTLSDGCLTISGGTVSSALTCGGNSKWATSSTSITPNGGLTTKVGVASTSPFSNIGIGASAGQFPFVIGSSTRSVFIVDNLGQVAVGTSTTGTSTLLVEAGGDQNGTVNYPRITLLNRVAGISSPAVLGSFQYNQGSVAIHYPIVELKALHQGSEQADWAVFTRGGGIPSVQQEGLRVRSGNGTNYVGIASSTPGATLAVTGKNTTTGVLAMFGDSGNTTRFYIQNNGVTGIGSTSPFAYFSINPPVASPGTTGGVSFAVGSSTHTQFAVQSNGDIVLGGGVTAPTIASCGTSPSLYSGNDNAGVISTGGVTAITACTLTYSHTVDAINRSCIAEMATTTGLTLSASTTATTLVITSSAAFQGKRVNYHCINTALNI